MPGSTPAWTRNPPAWPAMPAASSTIIQPVTENRWRVGIRSRPKYSNAPTATPAASPSREPAHSAGGSGAARGDAVEEQHDLGAFAQHRKPDDEREYIERPRAGAHVVADGAHVTGNLRAVPLHPDRVPREHQHRDAAGSPR